MVALKVPFLLFTVVFISLASLSCTARPLNIDSINRVSSLSISGTRDERKQAGKFGIAYAGGRLLTAPITVNLIIYGSKWAANVTAYTSAFSDFINSIKTGAATATVSDVKKWWAILTTYVDAKNLPVSTAVSLGKVITDLNSQGLAGLTDLSIQGIVKNALTKATLTPDSGAVYVVVTDSTVTLTNGFCKAGCGSHGSFAFNTFDIVYVHVGNFEVQCPSLCMPQFIFPQKGVYWQPPNKNAGLDAMINVLAHELGAAATDPNPNRLPVAKPGYYDGTTGPYRGQENTDFCAYDYGIVQLLPVSTAPVVKSTAYNVLGINKRQFLIQSNYDFKRKLCVLF